MKKENKILLALFTIEALINVGLARLLWFTYDIVSAIMLPYIFGSVVPLPLILKVHWWPWLLFVAASVCAVVIAFGAKRQTFSVLAIIILLVDIVGLAFTLFSIMWMFAIPMWGLSP